MLGDAASPRVEQRLSCRREIHNSATGDELSGIEQIDCVRESIVARIEWFVGVCGPVSQPIVARECCIDIEEQIRPRSEYGISIHEQDWLPGPFNQAMNEGGLAVLNVRAAFGAQ